MDIHELTPLADYFIFCNGTSERMLQALATTLREFVKQEFGKAVQIEGESRDGWLVADVDDIIVHIFSPDRRNYYKLEQLWGKGRLVISLQ